MELFTKLADEAVWEEYYTYKLDNKHLTRREEADLRKYIDNREYIGVMSAVEGGAELPLPQKKLIRKLHTGKKRTVYIYPREFNYVLKLLTFLLLRKYDAIFAESLYSFRVNSGVGKAMHRIMSVRNLKNCYTYKADISNYFNSIPVEQMLVKLREVLCHQTGEESDADYRVFDFLSRLLTEERIIDGTETVCERKGVMAGTPCAVFLANIYLMDLDATCEAEPGIIYARYSDDILVIADTAKKRDGAVKLVRDMLAASGLEMNPEKELFTSPGEQWSFLGIGYENGTIDISPVSKEKLKDKIRRRARALKRWQVRKGATPEQAAKAFISAMNRKFFSPDSSHELTWSRWYFPVINTDVTLHELDEYMQQWIRYIITGGHKKSSYRFKYEDIKSLGYVSLVHEWWKSR